jgi:hypothetical protein
MCIILNLTVALPMFGFARQLPEAKKNRSEDEDQSDDKLTANINDLSDNLKDLPKRAWVNISIVRLLL